MSGWESLMSVATQSYNANAPKTARISSDDAPPNPWQTIIDTYSVDPPATTEGGKVSEDWVVNGLVERGMPEHIARGFAMNMKDESGLNPGINEIEPTVPGSRGGFGLYQLTGPRRRAYESFAAKRGVNTADPEAQLDFLMYEIEGPERAAYQQALQTGSAGEAAAVIVNKFLRPAEEHRTRRANKYLQTSRPSREQSEAALSTTNPVYRGSKIDFSKLWLTPLGDSNG